MGCTAKTANWLAACLSLASVIAYGGDSPLADAVKNKETQTVRMLLKQHVNVNTPRADGSTALTWATHWDDSETADLLIRAGANVNAANDLGVTPLWEACNNRSDTMVAKLLAAGGDPNAALPGTGGTPLMRCARTGSVEAMKALLDHGANPNVKESQKGQTALMWALEERHTEVARLLIEHGADIHAKSNSGFTPLLYAARQGDLERARQLLERGADVNESTPGGLSVLLVAADGGHQELAMFLVEKGANVNAADPAAMTALHYSLRMGISILCEAGRGNGYPYPESYLFRPNMSGLAKVLLEHGTNPNARITKGTKLSAFAPDNVAPCNMSPTGGVTELGLAGATPFLLAAATGDVAMMRTLLDKGADPKLGTNDGVTPLMAAAGVGRAARLNRSREEQKQSVEAIKLMLQLSADINASSDDGLTALHGAAYSGANDVVQFLVENGANLNAKDRYGETPLSRAEGDLTGLVDFRWRFPHPGTAELIRKLGGDPLAQGSGSAAEIKKP